MSEIVNPKRLISIASKGNNALTITSILNAVNNGHYDINEILILHDKTVAKKDLDFVNEVLVNNQLNVKMNEIPIIDDLADNKSLCDFENGDCILVPAVQFHFALLLNGISRDIDLDLISAAYICHLNPSGKVVDWKAVVKQQNAKVIVKSNRLSQQDITELNWLLESEKINFDTFYQKLDIVALDNFVELESSEGDYQLIENELFSLTKGHYKDKKPGILFEKVVAHCFYKNKQIRSVIMNLELDAEWGHANNNYKEEDVICITRNGQLILVSCKFYSSSKMEKITPRLVEEVQKMENLALPLNIPKERITRLIVTRSAHIGFKADSDVKITNLRGIQDIIESI